MEAKNEKYTVGTKTAKRDEAARIAVQTAQPAVDCQGLIFRAELECGTWGRPILVEPTPESLAFEQMFD